MVTKVEAEEPRMHSASVNEIVAIARGRRLELGLSQTALAQRAGVSRKWVNEFESGKPGVEFGLALRLLAALDLDLALRRASDVADVAERGILDDVLAGVVRSESR